MRCGSIPASQYPVEFKIDGLIPGMKLTQGNSLIIYFNTLSVMVDRSLHNWVSGQQ